MAPLKSPASEILVHHRNRTWASDALVHTFRSLAGLVVIPSSVDTQGTGRRG